MNTQELGGGEQLPVSMAASSSTRVLNEAQATNGLLLSALEGYEGSGTTQKRYEDAKKTTAKNVTISFKYTLFVKMYYMQNDHNKQI